MKNLYSFSKDAWFVKLYKWLYNVDPTQKYKNMCPMFWAMVITFVLLPLVVIAKLFGNLSAIIYRDINVRKEINHQKRKQKFLEQLEKNLTPEEAYKLYYSNEWVIFSCYVSNELWGKIYDLKNQYNPPPRKKKSRFVINWDLVMIGFFSAVLLICIGGFLLTAPWDRVDWKKFGLAILNIIHFVVMVIGFHHIWKYIFNNNAVCNFFNAIWKFTSNIFNKIGHGIQIVYDMIYNIYKNNCPLIEWKEQDEKSN